VSPEMLTILKPLCWLIAVLRKAEVEIKFDDSLKTSQPFRDVGFKEIHFKGLDADVYRFAWILIPGRTLGTKHGPRYATKASEKSGYDCKLRVFEHEEAYSYLAEWENPVAYVFSNCAQYSRVKYVVLPVRPTFFLNFLLFKWLVGGFPW
jgi:hypothetical protein